MTEPSATPNTPASWSASATERPHVLIVTADDDLRQFLGEGLVYGGFWTSTVASAVQTLEIFRLRSFDLVLVDAALGGMGAAEAIRRLRGRSDRAAPEAARTDVPILLVADDATRLTPDEAQTADEVLSPPIDLAVLVPHLQARFQAWRLAHPDRPMADAAAQARPHSTDDPASPPARGTGRREP